MPQGNNPADDKRTADNRIEDKSEAGKEAAQGAGGNVFEKFAECCPEAAKAAKKLYETKWLDEAAADGKDFSAVFDHIITLIVSEQEHIKLC